MTIDKAKQKEAAQGLSKVGCENACCGVVQALAEAAV